jgi:hypothetical protein
MRDLASAVDPRRWYSEIREDPHPTASAVSSCPSGDELAYPVGSAVSERQFTAYDADEFRLVLEQPGWVASKTVFSKMR